MKRMLSDLNENEKNKLVLLMERKRTEFELHTTKLAAEARLKKIQDDLNENENNKLVLLMERKRIEFELHNAKLAAEARLKSFQDYLDTRTVGTNLESMSNVDVASLNGSREEESDSAESHSFDYNTPSQQKKLQPTYDEVLVREATVQEQPQHANIQPTNDEVFVREANLQGQPQPANIQPTNDEILLYEDNVQEQPQHANNQERTVSLSEAAEYIDGCVVIVPKTELQDPARAPTLGWAAIPYGDQRVKGGRFKKYYKKCLGVYRCDLCEFVARPRLPIGKKSKYSTPRPPKQTTCERHSSQQLTLVECNCFIQQMETADSWEVSCSGKHLHPRPPSFKPTAVAMKKLQSVIKAAPEVKPKDLADGTATRESVRQIHPSFHNKDRVAYHRRNIIVRETVPISK